MPILGKIRMNGNLSHPAADTFSLFVPFVPVVPSGLSSPVVAIRRQPFPSPQPHPRRAFLLKETLPQFTWKSDVSRPFWRIGLPPADRRRGVFGAVGRALRRKRGPGSRRKCRKTRENREKCGKIRSPARKKRPRGRVGGKNAFRGRKNAAQGSPESFFAPKQAKNPFVFAKNEKNEKKIDSGVDTRGPKAYIAPRLSAKGRSERHDSCRRGQMVFRLRRGTGCGSQSARN